VPQVNIVYFVHDLNHADIERRVQILTCGGATITLIGFYRGTEPTSSDLISLGKTVDGNLRQRIVAILGAIPKLSRHASEIRRGDAVLARNLETLAVAAVARAWYLPGKPLNYECLDIHRVMLQENPVSRFLRAVEGLLLKYSHAVVTSSPAFTSEYFKRYHKKAPRSILVENKVFPPIAHSSLVSGKEPPEGPPWRIGWFGGIRCKRSLEILANVATSAQGLLEVVVAGRPSRAVFGDTDAAFSGIPGVSFVGEFRDETELEKLYRSVDFAWAIDFFEAGANSTWLLPNRLYRAVYYGAIPIAEASVETGRWLKMRGVGINLDSVTPVAIIEAFKKITPADVMEMRDALEKVPVGDLVTSVPECRAIVNALIASRNERVA
jgi:succinoglycan biosynthesis protein ExoL